MTPILDGRVAPRMRGSHRYIPELAHHTWRMTVPSGPTDRRPTRHARRTRTAIVLSAAVSFVFALLGA